MIVDVTWRKIKLGSGKYTHFYCKIYFPLRIKNLMGMGGNYFCSDFYAHTINVQYDVITLKRNTSRIHVGTRNPKIHKNLNEIINLICVIVCIHMQS